MAWPTGQAWSQPAPSIDAQEQRRAQERERVLREQQEKPPDERRTPPAPAEAARLPVESPCVVIQQLGLKTVAGDSNPAARWDWALDAAAGPANDDSPLRRCVGTEGLNLILKRVQDAVMARGYSTTRILLEPQDLQNGAMTLTVLPGRIRAIRFAEPVDARANAWNAFAVKPGDILNLSDIEQALENFKRVPTAQADIKIEVADVPGSGPGQNDLVISYKQELPLRLSLSTDDSGSKATGKYQASTTLSFDNPLALNDLLYVSFNGDLGGGLPGDRGSRGRTAHYSVPYGYWLLGATASYNRYHQSVAGLNQTYVYSGTSSNLEVKLSRLVYRDAVRKTTVSFAAFRRSSNNFIDDTEVEVQQRKVGGWQAALNHREFIAESTLDTTLTYKRGTGAFNSMPAPEQAFGEGTSRFKLVTLDLSLTTPFQLVGQKFRYNASARIQANRSPLSPQDRFAIGGRYTVRGFDGESSLSAERGWLLRNDLGVMLGDSGQELYAGLDYGQVGGPSSDFLLGKHLVGVAIGLRGSLKKLQYDLFVGTPLGMPEYFRTASSTAGISLNYSF